MVHPAIVPSTYLCGSIIFFVNAVCSDAWHMLPTLMQARCDDTAFLRLNLLGSVLYLLGSLAMFVEYWTKAKSGTSRGTQSKPKSSTSKVAQSKPKKH